MDPNHTYDMEDASSCGACYREGALCEFHLREELARLRKDDMQQARIISELREEINAQDGEIKRLREELAGAHEDLSSMSLRSRRTRKGRGEAREALHTAEIALKMVSAHMSPHQPAIARAVRDALEKT